MDTQQLLDAGLVPVATAAAALGMDVKRLRGYVWRNKLADPIGSLETDEVYGWSCQTLAKRLADTSSAVQGEP